jgi:4a-hydroxytetrahydrobiopterin dehydratase
MSGTLSRQQLSAALPPGGDWKVEGEKLTRDYRFADFSEAFAFLTRVALAAEKAGHHPDIHNSYSRIRLELHSHDAGGVTQRDLELAQAIDKLGA